MARDKEKETKQNNSFELSGSIGQINVEIGKG